MNNPWKWIAIGLGIALVLVLIVSALVVQDIMDFGLSLL
jgi:uncharacterized membrane protein YukC